MKEIPPKAIQNAFEQLQLDNIKIAGPLRRSTAGTWYFEFNIEIEQSSNENVPLNTAWYLELGEEYPEGEISVYPAKIGGIEKTFPHMLYNADISEIRWWRTGKLCLDNPGFNIDRNKWKHEAKTSEARLKWHLQRTLHWTEAAANNTLLLPSDPLELPTLERLYTDRVIGFHENSESFDFWTGCETGWGIASISHIDAHISFVREFFDLSKNSLLELPWSKTFKELPSVAEAFWFKLPAMPVLKPWYFPSCWQELIEISKNDEGHSDLLDFLLSQAKHFRKHKEDITLLLGFPLPETLQSPAKRVHWIAVSNLRYIQKGTITPGFSPSEQNWLRQDRLKFTGPKKLIWLPSENWSSDQIKTRAIQSDELRQAKILLLGCGALGSSVAEILVRSGITNITVMDDDRLHVGNLCRHTLDIHSVTGYKADELARHLNFIAPDINAHAICEDFPPLKEAVKAVVCAHDVIIDCTASDDVLHSIANFNWKDEKAFISLSLTQNLDGLLVYTAFERSFPVIEAISRFQAHEAINNSPEAEPISEGLGCWNPIMPGEVENVFLAASVSVKFIKEAMKKRKRSFQFFAFEEDGSVKRL